MYSSSVCNRPNYDVSISPKNSTLPHLACIFLSFLKYIQKFLVLYKLHTAFATSLGKQQGNRPRSGHIKFSFITTTYPWMRELIHSTSSTPEEDLRLPSLTESTTCYSSVRYSSFRCFYSITSQKLNQRAKTVREPILHNSLDFQLESLARNTELLNA